VFSLGRSMVLNFCMRVDFRLPQDRPGRPGSVFLPLSASPALTTVFFRHFLIPLTCLTICRKRLFRYAYPPGTSLKVWVSPPQNPPSSLKLRRSESFPHPATRFLVLTSVRSQRFRPDPVKHLPPSKEETSFPFTGRPR